MRSIINALIAFSLLAGAGPLLAQAWPQKPIRMIVPYAPGGNLDISVRLIAPRMKELLGQAIVVENKPGAGGMIAGELVAHADPDGYTIFVGANGPLLFSPIILNRAAYDWRKDFATIGPISFTGLVLQTRQGLGPKTLAEFLELAGRKDLLMANAGAGSTNHLVSELVQMSMDKRWTTVNYKGNAPALAALLSGEVDFSFEQVSAAAPNIKAGKLVPLAVTSRTRNPLLPDVPTFGEAGVKDFEAVTWIGLFAPAGTPPEIVGRINEALRQTLADEALAARFAAMGSEARSMPTQAFAAFVAGEYEKWIPVIRRAGLASK
ncbi:MAG: Bug family tripartite tricarboxylate transporter substrate binding protein [Lautropia sp.]